MAVAYSTLTQPQKTACEHAAGLLRAELGRWQITLNHLQAALNEYNGNGVGTILATVTATEVVPNSTGLAVAGNGAGDVLVSDVTSMVTSVQAALTTYNTIANQQLYAHWAGGPNVLG